MHYYIDEPDTSNLSQIRRRNAGSKARNDVAAILESEGFECIDIPVDGQGRAKANALRKVAYQQTTRRAWKKATKPLVAEDVLVVQLPLRGHSVLLGDVFRDLRKRGVVVIVLVHDLELFRLYETSGFVSRVRIRLEELSILSAASRIIVHNDYMAGELATRFGIDRSKMICLELFDYLSPGFSEEMYQTTSLKDGCSFVIAGNLAREKAGYVYHLPSDVQFLLYGVGLEDGCGEADNVEYCGAFDPDEGPGTIEGSFGLVWDGPSVETCEGTYGQYLSINNPHKTSLCLAAGMPVVIWKKAALADFLEKHHAGVTVGSLYELHELSQMRDEDYRQLAEGAREISRKVRAGHYLKQAVRKALKTPDTRVFE